jgi:hypothetical protein
VTRVEERGADRWLRPALFVLSVAIQVPFLDRGISHHDEGSILSIADGLRHGQVLYRDRATFVAPLTYEIVRLLFGIFGSSFAVARILQALIFSGCLMVAHEILRTIVGRSAAVAGAVALLALKSWAFPAWTMLNYSQVAMLLCLTSVWLVSKFLEEHRLGWLALAALAIGVTVLAKQNIGVLLGGTIALTVAADTLYEPTPAATPLLRRAAVLALAGVPIVLAAAAYAAQGALGALVTQTILRGPAVAALYRIPLPVAVVWSADRGVFMAASFPYFPPTLFHLGWQERWDIARFPVNVAIELAIKAAYFIPLIAIAWCVVAACRSFRGSSGRVGWSRLVLVGTFALASYASMLYRADWIHLMNVYPPLLLACVVALQGPPSQPRWRARLGGSLLVLWVALGMLLTVLIFALNRYPVDTARGRILMPRYEADDTTRVLDYVARVPRSDHLAFMRHEPLYYFLTDREIPLQVDLVLPGYVGPGDDERMATDLARVDQVVFSPKFLPTVSAPLTDYAPRTARVLANDFRVSEVLGPSALVLRRRAAPVTRGSVTVDLWEAFAELRPEMTTGTRVDALPSALRDAVATTTWLVFRVVRSTVVRHEAETCFSLRHTVQPREEIVTMPLADPALWRGAERDLMPGVADLSVSAARFAITAEGGTTPSARLYTEERPVAVLGEPIAVPLEAFVGQTIDLRFCTAAAPDGATGPTRVPVGWAEPRIVRLPE